MPKRRKTFSPGVLGGFEPKLPPKKKFLARFTPSPDTTDRLAVARTANIRRGAAPTGGAGAREVGRAVTDETQAVKTGGTEGVLQLQRSLRASGFHVALDGIWGPQTEAAHRSRLRSLREAVQGNEKGAQEAVAKSFAQPGKPGADLLADTFGPAGFGIDKARRETQFKLSNAFEQRQAIKATASRLYAADQARASGFDPTYKSLGSRVAGWVNKVATYGDPLPHKAIRGELADLGRKQMEWAAGIKVNTSLLDLSSPAWKHLTEHDWLVRKTDNGVGRVGTTIQDYLQSRQAQAGIQQSGLGDVTGAAMAAGGFVSRAAGGIVTGALSTPGAVAYAVSDPKGLAKELERSYAWQYGPLAQGDIAEFAKRLNDAPAGPLMDLLTVATLGVGGAARAGFIPRLGPIRELHAPGHPPMQLRAARTQLMRYYQQTYDNFSMNHPNTPLIGSISRTARRLPFEREIRLDEALVASSPFKEALRTFTRKHKVSPGKRRIDATAYDRRLRYGDDWREGIAAEIAMRETRVQKGVDRAEFIYQNSEIRTLKRILGDYPEQLPAHVEQLVDEGVKLADMTEAMKIRLGMFSEETAAQRKQLSWEIVTDYRNIDSPNREGLDWLVRSHYSDELADAIMQVTDGFVWAKAGGPGGDINAAYGAFLQEASGDPFALPSAIVFPPGVRATSDVEILWQHTPEMPKLPDIELPALDLDAVMAKIPIDRLPKELRDPVVLKQALARVEDLTRRGIAYRDWYDRAARVVQKVAEKYGMDLDTVAQLVAIFSADTNPITGMNFVFQAMEQIKADGKVTKAGRYPQRQVAEANRVLRGEEWTGKKRNSFYQNILEPLLGREEFVRRFGNVNPVTVDRWVLRMFLDDENVAKRVQSAMAKNGNYEAFEQALTAMADQYGLTPKEVQAASWVTMKMLGETRASERRGWNTTPERNWHVAADAHELGWNKYFATSPEEYLFYQRDKIPRSFDNDAPGQYVYHVVAEHNVKGVQKSGLTPRKTSMVTETTEPGTFWWGDIKSARGWARPGDRIVRVPRDSLRLEPDAYGTDLARNYGGRDAFFSREGVKAKSLEWESVGDEPILFQREGGAERMQKVLDQQAGDDLIGLPGAVKVPGHGEVTWHSNAELQSLAEQYMAKAGMPYERPRLYIPVDPEKATLIARAFDAMPHRPTDPQVAGAYADFIRETMDQYQGLIDAGYRPEFYPEGRDPYPNSPRESAFDITENKHMYVYPTEAGFGSGDEFPGHPLMGVAEGVDWGNGKPVYYNDIFRFVHDVYGHVKEGVGFRADGEDNAWRSHASMYSENARRAMTVETRGQNSWVNYGPHGEKNRTASQMETVYADQKAGLLPDWVMNDQMPPWANRGTDPTRDMTIEGWEARRQMDADLGALPGTGGRIEDIPTARPEELSSQGAISDQFGPPGGTGRGQIGDSELMEMVEIPPDAYMMTKGEAYSIEADPRFVYHGTDDISAKRIMEERKIRPGGPLGSPLDRAWVSDDPFLAATHAGKASYAIGNNEGGTVIAIPRSAIPVGATKHLDSGTTTYAMGGEGYLFQRGKKTKITAEEVDSDVVRGAAVFDPAQRLRMFLGPEADASTPFHELAHGLRRHLPDVVGRDLWAAVEREVSDAVRKPIEMGKWPVEAEEYFARAATRWFREGDAPSPTLTDAYATISEALRSLYTHGQQAGPLPGPAMRAALAKGGRPFTGDPRTGAAFVQDVTRKGMRRGRGGGGFPRITGKELQVRRNRGVLFTRARHVSDPEVTLRDFERTTRSAFKMIQVEALEKFAQPWDWEAAPIREGYVPVIFRGKNPIPHIFQEEFDVMERTPKEYSAMVRQSEAEALSKVFPTPAQVRQLAQEPDTRVYQIPKKIRDAYLDRSVRIPAQAANDNPLTDAFDLANTITKGAVVYGKLSYIPVNYAGNVIFLTIDSGPLFAVNALRRSMKTLTDLDVEDLAWIDSQVGQGPAVSLATEKGRIADVMRDLAAWQSDHADRGPRRAAYIAAARRYGYKTKADLKRLRTDPELVKIGRQIGMEAEDAMVRFRGLTPFERDIMSRLIFLYGWTRGATRWLWNFTSEKPLVADLTYHLGQEGNEYIQRTLGVLPDYMRTLVPWGAKMKKRGVETVSVRDFQSVSPVATGAQVLEAGVTFAQGDPRAAGSQVVDFLSPALKTPIEMVTGQNLFLQEPYDNRFQAVTDQPGRWPLVKLFNQMIDPTVDVTDAYGNSLSRTNYLPPKDANEARLKELEYFLGGGVLRSRDLNLTQANARGAAQQRAKHGTPPWNEQLTEDAKKAGIKMPQQLVKPAQVKTELDDDPRTDSGTPYTQKLQAAVDAFAKLYPQNLALVKQSARRVADDEEGARLLYLRLRDAMFEGVNEFRGMVDDKLGEDG